MFSYRNIKNAPNNNSETEGVSSKHNYNNSMYFINKLLIWIFTTSQITDHSPSEENNRL